MELMVLLSMYEEELTEIVSTQSTLSYKLSLTLDDENETTLLLSCTIDRAKYGSSDVPTMQLFSLQCSKLHSHSLASLLSKVRAFTDEEHTGDMFAMKIVTAITILKESFVDFASAQIEPINASPPKIDDISKTRKKKNSFCREWCSFVALYKESYISGPNRFEVILTLANERGLAITGIAIAGKPGGLVAEGREGDVEQFMHLMRTEFMETLNPRGRKLTTRLVTKFPFDEELDRYEAAEAAHNLKKYQLCEKKR